MVGLEGESRTADSAAQVPTPLHMAPEDTIHRVVDECRRCGKDMPPVGVGVKEVDGYCACMVTDEHRKEMKRIHTKITRFTNSL